jgi:hypothetical protein
MNHMRCHPYNRDRSRHTSLHYAEFGNLEPHNDDDCTSKTTKNPIQDYPYVCAVDVPNVLWLDKVHEPYEPSPQVRGVNKGYSGRKVCINMLLQAGVDLWEKDNKGRLANPGRKISDEDFLNWWHEKIGGETLKMSDSLCQARNAISVMASLIATASYVGPLQPPLSYGSDQSLQPPTLDPTLYVHFWDGYVMVFLGCNSLAFYFAIASIMLSVVPSLPRVRESLLKEVKLIQASLACSIWFLLFAVFGIVISYTACGRGGRQCLYFWEFYFWVFDIWNTVLESTVASVVPFAGDEMDEDDALKNATNVLSIFEIKHSIVSPILRKQGACLIYEGY